MPIYEYACNACDARLSVFVRSMSSTVAARCERCGSDNVRRLISRVAVIRSGSDEFASLDDDSMMSGFDENDPRAMAAWARRMRREMGDDLGPEMEEMIEKMERGEGLGDEFGGDEDESDGEGFEDY